MRNRVSLLPNCSYSWPRSAAARAALAASSARGKFSSQLVVTRTPEGQGQVSARLIESTAQGAKILSSSAPKTVALTDLWLAVAMDFTTDKSSLGYSPDGKTWVAMPGDFPLAFDWRTGTFQGQQYSLFCYNPKGGQGRLDVDSFSLGKP